MLLPRTSKNSSCFFYAAAFKSLLSFSGFNQTSSGRSRFRVPSIPWHNYPATERNKERKVYESEKTGERHEHAGNIAVYQGEGGWGFAYPSIRR